MLLWLSGWSQLRSLRARQKRVHISCTLLKPKIQMGHPTVLWTHVHSIHCKPTRPQVDIKCVTWNRARVFLCSWMNQYSWMHDMAMNDSNDSLINSNLLLPTGVTFPKIPRKHEQVGWYKQWNVPELLDSSQYHRAHFQPNQIRGLDISVELNWTWHKLLNLFFDTLGILHLNIILNIFLALKAITSLAVRLCSVHVLWKYNKLSSVSHQRNFSPFWITHVHQFPNSNIKSREAANKCCTEYSYNHLTVRAATQRTILYYCTLLSPFGSSWFSVILPLIALIKLEQRRRDC